MTIAWTTRAQADAGDGRSADGTGAAEVALPATVAYAALLLAQPLCLPSPLVDALQQALTRAADSAAGQRLRAAAAFDPERSVLPFVRPELDLHFTALMLAGGHSQGFRLCGHGMRVPTGYLRLQHGQVSLIDTVEDERVLPPELLCPPQVQRLLALLQADPVSSEGKTTVLWSTLEVPEQADEPLLIRSPLLQRFQQSPQFAAHRRSPRGERRRGLGVAVDVRIVQVPSNADGADSAAPLNHPHPLPGTRLGTLTFEVSEGVMRPQSMRVEWLMELQAAAMTGAWLALEQAGCPVYVGPLPDLTVPGARARGWHSPSEFWNAALGLEHQRPQPVSLPAIHAAELMRLLPWAVMESTGHTLQLGLRMAALLACDSDGEAPGDADSAAVGFSGTNPAAAPEADPEAEPKAAPTTGPDLD